MTVPNSADVYRQAVRQLLEKKLGFSLDSGARRWGELRCSPVPDAPEFVHLEIPGSIVTIAQAKAIRDILLDTPVPCRQCGEPLSLRDLGWFPLHTCKKKGRKA